MKIHSTLIFILFTIAHTYAQKRSETEYTFNHGVALSHWIGNVTTNFSYADPRWFSERDSKWIADQGFDHIQMYCALTDMVDKDGKLMPEKLTAIDSAVSWCKRNKLGLIISPVRFPKISTDTSLTQEQQNIQRIEGSIALYSLISDHLSGYDEILRLSLDHGSKDEFESKLFFKKGIEAIRKKNLKRKIYLKAYSSETFDHFYVPSHDKNILLAISMANFAEDKAGALDVLELQHSFSKKIPLISFPGLIPAIADSSLASGNKWIRKFSNTVIDKNYIVSKFKEIQTWKNKNFPDLQFYISNWRFYTGYPFNPDTVKDSESIVHFVNAFTESAKEFRLGWCIYDYNSGSCMRYPSGEQSLVLKALQLDK